MFHRREIEVALSEGENHCNTHQPVGAENPIRRFALDLFMHRKSGLDRAVAFHSCDWWRVSTLGGVDAWTHRPPLFDPIREPGLGRHPSLET
jgi:hypothetical protein